MLNPALEKNFDSSLSALSHPLSKPFSVDHIQVKRILTELSRAMTILFGHELRPGILQLAPSIGVYGSARPEEFSQFSMHRDMYQMFRETGQLLARLGFVVVTGGGPGAMEAANRGCQEGGTYSAGVGIRLPFEQTNNAFLDKSLVSAYFCTRKTIFAKACKGFICGPGGYGTLDELFEMWNLELRTGRTQNKPIVLMGREFWKPLHDLMRHYNKQYGVISDRSLSMISLADTPEEATWMMKRREAQCPELFEAVRVYDKQMLRLIKSDLLTAMHGMVHDAPYVSVIGGSSNCRPDHQSALKAEKLGALLGQAGIPTLTTGINGLTSSFNNAVRAHGGKTTGFVQAGYEQQDNDFLDQELSYHYRITAELASMKYGSRVELFFPGGAGMLDRLFEQATLIQTKKIPDRRIVCVGKEFFQPMVDLLESEFANKYRTTSPNDHLLFEIVDTAEEAFEIARDSRHKTLIDRLEKAA